MPESERSSIFPAAPKAEGTIPIGVALRRVFKKGYRLHDLWADILAGTVVGIVALPLSMALAIAVGVPPQHGLYTAIFAGVTVALLGGSKFQITGPTAAFVVILAPIATKHGLSGLLFAGFMAGIFLVVMGVARLGSWVHYIPFPVTTGFTTGIAIVIATLQLKDALGLQMGAMPDHYVAKLAALWDARSSLSLAELAITLCTLVLLLGLPRILRKIPAPLVAIALIASACALLQQFFPEFQYATIGNRFHTTLAGIEIAGIPGALPQPTLPWTGLSVNFALVRELLPAALTIALLAAIESLLSAVIADGMTHTKHEPNSELVALGIGNIVAPVFGGIAATAALARTATNIRAGARSPFSAVAQSVFVLLAILVMAPWLAYLPMASLAALLLLTAWNMAELRHFSRLLRIASKSDIAVLLICCGLTVFIDMVVALSVGIVLAAFLFMKRMAELTQSRVRLDFTEEDSELALPEGVILYEINGPLFFGAAQSAMSALSAIRGKSFQVMIIALGKVPVIDATGFAALENTILTLQRRKKAVVLAGPLPKPQTVFDRAQLQSLHKNLLICTDLGGALRSAETLCKRTES